MIGFLILISIVISIDAVNASPKSYKAPDWVERIFTWYQNGLISESEVVNALDFLADIDVILVSDVGNILFENKVGNQASNYQIMVTKGEKHLVDLDKIKNSVPKDAIPSIDNPKFVAAVDADFISNEKLVVGINLNGEKKAYPLFILTWHEIVNDVFGDIPIAVTYCPLCFTNQVFVREIGGKPVEFGVAGKLYNSNLVMYDRMTDSYWSQAIGLAIKGELTGTKLERIPFDLLKWKDWRLLYPDTQILTPDTGHPRPYSSNPYSDYFKDPRVLFPLENKDERIPLKEIVFGFEDNFSYKAYRLKDVESNKIINDSVGDLDILLVSTYPFMGRAFDRLVDDQILEFEYSDNMILDKQTGSRWNLEGQAISGSLNGKQLQRIVYDPGFWFEWAAFHPETDIYGDSEMKNNPRDIEQMARGQYN